MGKPQRCAPRQKPFIIYNGITTTSTTTTIEPDYSNNLILPNSGQICPTTTLPPNTTTTKPPRIIDPNFPCSSYSFLPSDNNGAVITFSPCDNNNSVNHIVVGSIQRLDFCAENDGDVEILSGNGSIVFNGGCDRFGIVPGTTTTTTTTTSTTTTLPNKLYRPTNLIINLIGEYCYPDGYPIFIRNVSLNNDFSNITQYPNIPRYLVTVEILESVNQNPDDPFWYLDGINILFGGSQYAETASFCPNPGRWYKARAKVEAYSLSGEKLSEYIDSDYAYSNWFYIS